MDSSFISQSVSALWAWIFSVALALVAIYVWTYYTRAYFIVGGKRVLLEVLIPNGTVVSQGLVSGLSPSLHQIGMEQNWLRRFFAGSVRPWFSFEIRGALSHCH